jgi:hypothetical protein
MPTNRPITKILLDGGDPDETLRIRNLLGFLDGQTTNPTFVAKNPDVQRRIASGHKLSREEQKEKYKQTSRRSLLWSARLVSRSRSLRTSTLQLSRWSLRARRCFPGYRMPISSTRASGRDCALQRYRLRGICAST